MGRSQRGTSLFVTGVSSVPSQRETVVDELHTAPMKPIAVTSIALPLRSVLQLEVRPPPELAVDPVITMDTRRLPTICTTTAEGYIAICTSPLFTVFPQSSMYGAYTPAMLMLLPDCEDRTLLAMDMLQRNDVEVKSIQFPFEFVEKELWALLDGTPRRIIRKR